MVLECNKEDTGVGPSMAFGSQEQKTVIEDFVRTAKNAIEVPSKSKKQKSKKSPIRFKFRARKDLDWADSRE